MDKKVMIPELSLVMLVGTSGSGKSTFARKHFKATEVISSDACRAMISDNENDQKVTKEAFELLLFIAAKRLALGKPVVIDATNVQVESRRHLIELARKYHVIPVALIFDLPRQLCYERNLKRPERQFGKHVIWNQHTQLHRSLKYLHKEGIRYSVHFTSVEEMDAAQVSYTPLWNNKKQERGPFDIIGDVHGCFDELYALLEKLGYEIKQKEGTYQITHPERRTVVFVGDLVDRGPKIPEVLQLIMDMVASGIALSVNGNHDEKLKQALQGKKVKISHGLGDSLEQLEKKDNAFKKRVLKFLDGLISHYVFDDGKLVVSHAGIKEEFIGRGSAAIRAFCMYGEVTGETDEFGFPVRHAWAREYRGEALVVYGHVLTTHPEWVNNTITLDTGCVFGGRLTALRYPEKELVSVPAAQVYADSKKPLTFQPAARLDNDLLAINDVMGKRQIATTLHHHVTVHEEQASAALEVMSRFAIDPRWLIYLPPTMSPTDTSNCSELLEHPFEVFSYYKKHGVSELICQEKHMGSRLILIVCKNAEVAHKRFGVAGDVIGVCYSRTGRSFFSDQKEEQALLQRVSNALDKADLWKEHATDWFCFDAELMPWSAKAQSLLKNQYAPVGVAAVKGLSSAITQLKKGSCRIEGIEQLLRQYSKRLDAALLYREAYRRYCWPVTAVDDYKLAPFHLLATEGSLNMDKSHLWHMGVTDSLHEVDPQLFVKTRYQLVSSDDEKSCAAAESWWQDLVRHGSEGMVVKPVQFTVQGEKGLLQPGIKCRGREYLRIIYGAEYTTPENIARLKGRDVRRKRSLALREYALGYEALKRFVARDPLYKVHEAVFGVLALESEAVDPRL